MRCVVLLRGVNVNGHRLVPMADLRQLLADLGYTAVQTYIQSGNVVCAPPPGADPATGIRAAIARRFGHDDVGVVVLSGGEMAEIAAGNPFPREGADPRHLYVTVLSAPPPSDRAAALAAVQALPDRCAIARRWIYMHCPGGYHRTTLSNAFFERAAGVPATTRNWQTTLRLAEWVRPGADGAE